MNFQLFLRSRSAVTLLDASAGHNIAALERMEIPTFDPPIGAGPDTIVLIAGSMESARELVTIVDSIIDRGYQPMIIVDAIVCPEDLTETFISFHYEMVGLKLTGGIPELRTAKWHIPSVHNRPEVSVAFVGLVQVPGDYLVLHVTRTTYPQGLALPSGFPAVQVETAEETVFRTVLRETGLKIDMSRLVLVDLYTNPSPKRDRRGHIYEACYAQIFPESPKLDQKSGPSPGCGIVLPAFARASALRQPRQAFAFEHHRGFFEKAVKMAVRKKLD